MRELRGHSVGNMKVRVTTNDVRGLSETHSYTDFVTAGQDAIALVAFLAHFIRMQTQSSKLADFSISCAKVRDTCSRRCRYPSTSKLSIWLDAFDLDS
jgi:hypothetical protein